MSSKNVLLSGSKVDGDTEDTLRRQGSFRKLLPGNSNCETQLSMSAKMIERPAAAPHKKEYAVYLQEYIILSEYNMMRHQDFKGIYVIPSAQNSSLWFGVLFVRQGIYQGGVFRFTITLPQNFPEGGCPKVTFQSKIFHPLINSETGELNSTWGFSEWRRNNRVWQLVQYIVKIFSKLDSKMPATNSEALSLLENDLDNFQERAKESVKESLRQVYDPPTTEDSHYITFSSYVNELHDSVKQGIYRPKAEEENVSLGFSWVQPGSLQPFSKPEAR